MRNVHLVSGLPFNSEYQSNGKLNIESHPSKESTRFKDIVANMKEEDNSVLMIVTLK